MCRLLVHVEGQTEETFVKEVLAPHLQRAGYRHVGARLIGDPRLRRGGIQGWNKVKRDILSHLKQDRTSFHTTMVDYYGLPQSGERAWPMRSEASGVLFHLKAELVQQAMLTDISGELGDSFYPVRFLPFVIMHEFEGLLFSDPNLFAQGIARPELAPKFREIRRGFNSPEEINDSAETAPSKRVLKLIPSYEKPFLGTLAVLEIGLEAIRSECQHFNKWITLLEEWPRT